jgi:hypothetical protein
MPVLSDGYAQAFSRVCKFSGFWEKKPGPECPGSKTGGVLAAAAEVFGELAVFEALAHFAVAVVLQKLSERGFFHVTEINPRFFIEAAGHRSAIRVDAQMGAAALAAALLPQHRA